MYNICFTLIIFPNDKYKMYIEYLSSMVNYITFYHGINSCMFKPYAITQDFSNNYTELYVIVDNFLKAHNVITIYCTEEYIKIIIIIIIIVEIK